MLEKIKQNAKARVMTAEMILGCSRKKKIKENLFYDNSCGYSQFSNHKQQFDFIRNSIHWQIFIKINFE